jgi:hypothetical protein
MKRVRVKNKEERRRKKAINTSSRYEIETRNEQYKCPATPSHSRLSPAHHTNLFTPPT